jgi:hypothetical protein
MREFVGTVVQKLPLPARFIVKHKGYFTKQLGLVRVCVQEDARVQTDKEFTVSTKDWAKSG